ncbi:dehydrogenase/reductase SDR family member 4-like [Anoplophora glabripennis]|uniref:dehydrogenase/reductase SDR family member 4-like n=1 Tax=Anoplophora glabripennis TaxID=217634 RepID=UPI00087502A3|nr:dehydrogenase/reductase SDR family member 4-like [Anoplophora glabripennis]
MNRLVDRIAIVTGSTKGIGYSIARRLAQEGAKVIICSRKKENVEAAKKKLLSECLDIEAMVCDVANPCDREKLLKEAEKWGRLDILVSNVAVDLQSVLVPIFDCSESTWDKVFEVNVKVSYLLSKEALPLLRKSNAGRIIYVSALGAYFAQNQMGVYAISKVALLGLTKQGALHLAQENITVNCIAPGLIETDLSKSVLETADEIRKKASFIPLNRAGSTEEVSGTAAFLASDDASYITGETIVVGGGVQSRL